MIEVALGILIALATVFAVVMIGGWIAYRITLHEMSGFWSERHARRVEKKIIDG